MGDSYASLPGSSGNHITTPHKAAYHPTASIDVRYDGIGPWGAGTFLSLLGKWESGGSLSWVFGCNSGGVFTNFRSTDGSGSGSNNSSAHGISASTRYQVRWLCAIGGNITFYKRDPALSLGLTDDTNWTQVSTHAVTAALFNGTGALLTIGAHTNAGAFGFSAQSVYEACVKVDGVTQANPVFHQQANGTTSFADAQGNTWTLNGTASIVDPTPPGGTPAIVVPSFNFGHFGIR